MNIFLTEYVRWLLLKINIIILQLTSTALCQEASGHSFVVYLSARYSFQTFQQLMDAALSEIALRLEPRFYGVSLDGVFLGIFSLTMFIFVQLLLQWVLLSARIIYLKGSSTNICSFALIFFVTGCCLLPDRIIYDSKEILQLSHQS